MPADDDPPPPFKGGFGWRQFNERFQWIYERLLRPGDTSVDIVPGVGGKPGYIYAAGGNGAAAKANRPWQLYKAPHLGSGAAPSDQGRKIMVRPGVVSDGIGSKVPANRNVVITVPASNTGGYFGWLAADVDATGRMTSLVIAHGVTLPPDLTLPPDDPTGTPPPKSYFPLFIITSTASQAQIGEAIIFADSFLMLTPQITSLSSNVGRRMVWSPLTNPLKDVT